MSNSKDIRKTHRKNFPENYREATNKPNCAHFPLDIAAMNKNTMRNRLLQFESVTGFALKINWDLCMEHRQKKIQFNIRYKN